MICFFTKIKFKKTIAYVLLWILVLFYFNTLFAATLGDSVSNKRVEKENSHENLNIKEKKTIFEKYKLKTKREYADIHLSKKQDKDPRLACLLSLTIPGSGHIYLRKDLKGMGFCLAAGIGYTLTGYFIYKFYFGSGKNESSNKKMTVTGLILLSTLVVHVVSIIEAYSDGEKLTKKRIYDKGSLGNPYSGKIKKE